MEGDISPGLFHLCLPINDKDISKDAIKRKLIDIEYDLKASKCQAEEFAILNLIGLLHYHLEQYGDAKKAFHKVISQDGQNLNAIANTLHVLKKVYGTVVTAEAKDLQNELDKTLQSSPKRTGCSQSTEGTVVQDLEINQHRSVKAKARCLGEQAFTYACDLHTDQEYRDRFIKSNEMFQEALQLAGNLVETSEEDMWKFHLARNEHKIFNSYSYQYSPKHAMDHLENAVNLFYEIAQRNSKYQWESWRNLADIFRSIKKRRHLSSENLPRTMKSFINEPEICMKKAMDISPDNPRLLARYANFLYSLNRERTSEVLELLKKSISLDGSDYNYYAFSTRGSILLGNLKWQMGKAEHDSNCLPLNQVSIEMAKGDMEKAIGFRNAAWDLLNMAELYHLLAQSSTESRETRKEYLEKGLTYLTQAADCESGDRQKHVLQSRGRCFFDLGEYQESVNCFKQASGMLSKNSPFTGYFYEMFRSYLCLLREPKQAKNKSLLGEMAEALGQAIKKYGTSNLINYCFSTLQSEYKDELLELTEYCKTQPKYDFLMEVLILDEPASPLALPVRAGGRLKETWANTYRQQELDQMTVEDDALSVPSAVEDDKPVKTPTEVTSRTGSAKSKQEQEQEEAGAACSSVMKQEESQDLGIISGAGAAATTQPSGNIYNINFTGSYVNLGHSENNTVKFGSSITDGKSDGVSQDEIETLQQVKKLVGEQQLKRIMSAGLQQAQQKGVPETQYLCEGSSATYDATLGAQESAAAASLVSGISNMEITELQDDCS